MLGAKINVRSLAFKVKAGVKCAMMEHVGAMEVTITHNMPDKAEVVELFRRRLIAIDWMR